MYSLDINFLKDRGLTPTENTPAAVAKTSQPINTKIPIIAGAIAAVLLPALTFMQVKSLEKQQAEAEQKIQEIDAEIARIGNQNQTIKDIQAQIDSIYRETKALVTVFDQIKPWSAILLEVGERMPPGVQIDSIQQSGSGNNIQLTMAGIARSYDDVNDFVLFMQRSPFFSGGQTKLDNANLANFAIDIENEVPDDVSVNFAQGVKYRITTRLSNVPASKLMRELEKKGSVGLVTRLKTLERKGAI